MAYLPTNESEVQLFRLLQRANLLNYYDSFIQNGGDDVQQLYDAYQAHSTSTAESSSNEEKMNEFIEIMKMVGMCKPLHVRRLQKVLREWGANPAEFLQPVQPNFISNPPLLNRPIPMLPYNNSMNNISNRSNGLPNHGQSMHNIIPTTSSLPPQLSVSAPLNSSHSNKLATSASLVSTPINPTTLNSSVILSKPVCTVTRSSLSNSNLCKSPTGGKNDATYMIHQAHLPMNQILKASTSAINSLNMATNTTMNGNLNMNLNANLKNDPNILQPNPMNACIPLHSNGQCHPQNQNQQNQQNENDQLSANSPICMTNVLKDEEIQKITDCAVKLTEALQLEIDTRLEPISKELDNIGQKKEKKKSVRNVEHILNMPEDHPERVEEMRKYGSIYGRSDCRRKPDKPLSMHEIYVNEAALQLCKLKPLFLADRQTLFILAREVVKQANYKFSKGRSRSQFNYKLFDESNGEGSNLMDGNENDSIDIETYKDDDDKEYESDMSSSDVRSDYRKSLASLKAHLLNMGNNNLNVRKHGLFKEETNDRLSNHSDHEESKSRSDQLDMINKQIEMSNLQINELRLSKEVNEAKPKLIQLEDDLKLLIEEKNNLLKKFQKLDSLTLSSKTKNVKNINSDSEDDTNSQSSSIYSRASSKDEQNCTNSSLLKSSPLLCNQSINSDNLNNSSHCSNELSSRSSLKRKLLECSPQNKYLKTQKTDDETKSYAQPDEDRNGIDLRIQVIGSLNRKDKKQ